MIARCSNEDIDLQPLSSEDVHDQPHKILTQSQQLQSEAQYVLEIEDQFEKMLSQSGERHPPPDDVQEIEAELQKLILCQHQKDIATILEKHDTTKGEYICIDGEYSGTQLDDETKQYDGDNSSTMTEQKLGNVGCTLHMADCASPACHMFDEIHPDIYDRANDIQSVNSSSPSQSESSVELELLGAYGGSKKCDLSNSWCELNIEPVRVDLDMSVPRVEEAVSSADEADIGSDIVPVVVDLDNTSQTDFGDIMNGMDIVPGMEPPCDTFTSKFESHSKVAYTSSNEMIKVTISMPGTGYQESVNNQYIPKYMPDQLGLTDTSMDPYMTGPQDGTTNHQAVNSDNILNQSVTEPIGRLITDLDPVPLTMFNNLNAEFNTSRSSIIRDLDLDMMNPLGDTTNDLHPGLMLPLGGTYSDLDLGTGVKSSLSEVNLGNMVPLEGTTTDVAPESYMPLGDTLSGIYPLGDSYSDIDSVWEHSGQMEIVAPGGTTNYCQGSGQVDTVEELTDTFGIPTYSNGIWYKPPLYPYTMASSYESDYLNHTWLTNNHTDHDFNGYHHIGEAGESSGGYDAPSDYTCGIIGEIDEPPSDEDA